MLKLTYENFWEEYPRLVSLLFPPISEEDGLLESDIIQAEERLGIKISTLLREFYQKAGKHESNSIYDFLILPDKLQLYDNRYVAFMEENQGCYLIGWDIESAENNPPTLFLSVSRGTDWEPEAREMSSSFAYLLLVQATRGDALPYGYGDGAATRKKFETFTEDWLMVEVGNLVGAIKEKAALLFFPGEKKDEKGMIWGACSTAEDARAFEEILDMGFEWLDVEEEI